MDIKIVSRQFLSRDIKMSLLPHWECVSYRYAGWIGEIGARAARGKASRDATCNKRLKLLALRRHPRATQMGENLRGNTIRGNRAESLREENLPPRGSPRAPPKTSKRLPFVTQSSLPVYLSEVFGGPFGDPLGRRKMFLSETLGRVATNRVAP